MFVKTIGQGPELVLLHGWSMNSSVWQPLLPLLESHFTVHQVDLPGHGQSDWQAGAFDLKVLSARLAKMFPQPAVWLGWSLGGQLALKFATLYPQLVSKLVMLASTPKFVANQNWSTAMPSEIFTEFSASLKQNQANTLQRFISLQGRGANSREVIRQLKKDMAEVGIPHSHALIAGLALLETLDLRGDLAELSQPLLCLLGEKDQLIPNSLAASLSQLHAQAQIKIIDAAGHAPFVSHPEICGAFIKAFAHD